MEDDRRSDSCIAHPQSLLRKLTLLESEEQKKVLTQFEVSIQELPKEEFKKLFKNEFVALLSEVAIKCISTEQNVQEVTSILKTIGRKSVNWKSGVQDCVFISELRPFLEIFILSNFSSPPSNYNDIVVAFALLQPFHRTCKNELSEIALPILLKEASLFDSSKEISQRVENALLALNHRCVRANRNIFNTDTIQKAMERILNHHNQYRNLTHISLCMSLRVLAKVSFVDNKLAAESLERVGAMRLIERELEIILKEKENGKNSLSAKSIRKLQGKADNSKEAPMTQTGELPEEAELATDSVIIQYFYLIYTILDAVKIQIHSFLSRPSIHSLLHRCICAFSEERVSLLIWFVRSVNVCIGYSSDDVVGKVNCDYLFGSILNVVMEFREENDTAIYNALRGIEVCQLRVYRKVTAESEKVSAEPSSASANASSISSMPEYEPVTERSTELWSCKEFVELLENDGFSDVFIALMHHSYPFNDIPRCAARILKCRTIFFNLD
ncbi:uncharacterized protein MONOS_18358 [Monocercomonoides exilis]|uniref:uncharacterized protein n=1 Tax=Monocercomonoides exilis TaxID=2049356 RepID=UPI0035593AC2|nr:hypothetical protein MONOS_18358 [Monocercomonoides exilis]